MIDFWGQSLKNNHNTRGAIGATYGGIEMDNQNINVNEEVKTYTQEEVDALLQSESDKRVSQALKTQQKKYEKQLSLATLDEEQRAKALHDDELNELRQQLAELQAERNKSEMRSALSARGLPAEFADIMTIGESVEEAQENIEALDRLFKASVKAEVEKRLVGNAPKGNGNSSPAKNIKNMSLAELAKEMG